MNSTDVRREWAQRSGEFSPAYYAYYGPNETSDVVRRLLERFLDRDAAVLELGCSSGRHLSHLFDHGFDTLAGIDVNDDAFDVMEGTYPDLAASGEFYHGAIEDVIGEFDDDQFDAVYSVETLQHVHPDAEWVFDELSRITADLLITVENEGGPDRTGSTDDVNYVNDEFPLYYRDWNAIFTDRGFVEVAVTSERKDTIRTFQTASSRSGR
ncbi:class I SAM-dependent methyltransferase [Natronobeatus ordinarius]|uniref:class I SAM-dependent methyltransferase n=1 Tax=Natronobeatus ordinarius TaxID=2963433 RepID=UPI0020CDF06E|nr:class I SAM-dependent methyltransferase [Natronobeatus ordinarius]